MLTLVTKQQMFRFLIPLLGLVCALPAQASGLWFTRSPVASTTLRDCSGSLVEKFVLDSSITNEGRDYMLICLTGQNKAEWVFRAGFHCDATLGDDAKDDPYHVSPTWCKDEYYQSLSNGQIMVKGEHGLDKTSLEWHFTRYGIGTDCYFYTSPTEHWSCKDVKVRFDQDLSFITKAAKPFVIDRSDTADMWFADFSKTVEVACRVGRHGPKQQQRADCSGKDTTYKFNGIWYDPTPKQGRI